MVGWEEKGWPVEWAVAWTSFVLEGFEDVVVVDEGDAEDENDDIVRAAAGRGNCTAPSPSARNFGAAALAQQFVLSCGERQQ